MRHHGVDPDKRRTIGREKTLAMKELWTNDEASYRGTYVDFAPSWQWPKPVQRPHPPVWVGGGKSTMHHAVEWGDGWMPIEGVMPVIKMVHRLRQMAEEAGRDPSTLTIYLSGGAKDPAKIDEYVAAGIDGISMGVSWDADLDAARRELDDNKTFRDRYVPT
jgi:alkanesulfonate monooxygenase SsuD/methylene tetrahydromethanopterin reductase-like flavin-dependent oxidoreductase (luciferase family)